MRKETTYNKVVNVADDGEITVLADTFEYSSETENIITMRGATGNKFYPITEEQIQERIGDLEGDDMEVLKYYADNFGGVTSQMIDKVDSSREALINLFFDDSYRYMWDDLREQCGLTEEQAVIFDCVGGGRCFDEKYHGNINPELSEIIRQYEKAP